jgi:antitoxin CptB
LTSRPAPDKARAMPDTTQRTLAERLKRLQFRAWHRGTREADYMIGGFFDRYAAAWSETEVAWFEALIEEDDVDIMAWALGTLEVPEEYRGVQMELMRKLDYVEILR